MLTRLLPIVPLLLCPLLMLVCLWAMRGMGNRATPQERTSSGEQEMRTAARVAQLERELADLRGPHPIVDSAGPESVDGAADPRHEVHPAAPVQPG